MTMEWKRYPLDTTKQLSRWFKQQSRKIKALLAMVATFVFVNMICLVLLADYALVFSALSELIHALGIIVLANKLLLHNNCSGLSLKSQELTAIYLFAKIICQFAQLVDLAKFISTIWVIYMMKFWLQSTYVGALDNHSLYYTVVPAAVLSLIFHPNKFFPILDILWAFSAFVESVSVLPQLRLMQHAKVVEPFTAHYVFALAVSRFFSCVSWILHVAKDKHTYFQSAQILYMWPFVNLVTEAVNTFIMAEFCYYYVKSVMEGQQRMTLPSCSKNSKPT